jgi:hypothetical protein
MAEINFGVYSGFTGSIQQVSCKWEGVAVFPRNFIETAEIDTKSEFTILLPDEENRSSVNGGGGMDKSGLEVFGDELLKGFDFFLRVQVNPRS